MTLTCLFVSYWKLTELCFAAWENISLKSIDNSFFYTVPSTAALTTRPSLDRCFRSGGMTLNHRRRSLLLFFLVPTGEDLKHVLNVIAQLEQSRLSGIVFELVGIVFELVAGVFVVMRPNTQAFLDGPCGLGLDGISFA